AAQPTTSDYTLAYDGTNYTLTDRATGTVVGTSTSMPASIGGLNFSFSSGSMSAGDKFTVQRAARRLHGELVAGAHRAGREREVQPADRGRHRR
ncbi:hypothetical protein QM334_37655, partial [Burkholderia cenocepacia]|nr:hypothetical protein [Burkholderia cenocepacia]